MTGIEVWLCFHNMVYGVCTNLALGFLFDRFKNGQMKKLNFCSIMFPCLA